MNQKLPVLYSLLILLIIMAGTGCTSTKQLVNSGQYDEAIAKTVKKLQRNKNKEKQIIHLQGAFFKANQRDLDRINFLKKEDRPEHSVEIHSLYSQIKHRQDLIKPLLPLYIDGREVQFRMVDVDADLIAYKKEAAGYLYNNALLLIASNDKYNSRQAYYDLLEVKKLYNDFKDVDDQVNRAFQQGQNYVLYAVNNKSPNIIPKQFVEQLYNLNFRDMEGIWYSISTYNKNTDENNFDYKILVNLNFVEVGPEQVKEVHYNEVKEIQDGWTYVYDKKGNVKKDSLGNDIKTPKYKEISAHVTETQQIKEATFEGEILIINLNSGQRLRTFPLNTRFLFKHFSATAQGNLDALKEETRKRIRSRPLPFPSDFQMIMDGNIEMKTSIRNRISQNRSLLEG